MSTKEICLWAFVIMYLLFLCMSLYNVSLKTETYKEQNIMIEMRMHQNE